MFFCVFSGKNTQLGLILFVTVYSQQWTGSTDLNSSIYRNGNVGIGISPSFSLHVNKYQDGVTFINVSNSSEFLGSGSGIRFYTRQDNGGGSWWSNIAIKGDRMLHFNMEQKEDAMIISQTGQVGIGTIALGLHRLAVNGTIGTNGLQIDNNTDGLNLIYVNNSSYSVGSGSGIKFWTGQDNGGGSWWSNIVIKGDRMLHFNMEQKEDAMVIKQTGQIGIGTTTTGTHKLAVEGTIGAREIKVEADGWSDFVFNKDYELKDLTEVENFIEENNHLPNIPSEKEVMENGIQLGEMDGKLLQKIEELTLYMIEQNKRTNKLVEEVQGLKVENELLKEKISTLKPQ